MHNGLSTPRTSFPAVRWKVQCNLSSSSLPHLAPCLDGPYQQAEMQAAHKAVVSPRQCMAFSVWNLSVIVLTPPASHACADIYVLTYYADSPHQCCAIPNVQAVLRCFNSLASLTALL